MGEEQADYVANPEQERGHWWDQVVDKTCHGQNLRVVT